MLEIDNLSTSTFNSDGDTEYSNVKQLSMLRIEDTKHTALAEEPQKPKYLRNDYIYSTTFSDESYDDVCQFKRFYLGFRTPKQAEVAVSRRTDFKIYKPWPISLDSNIDEVGNILSDIVELTIVYRKSNGSFAHYPVREVNVLGYESVRYFVDYNELTVSNHFASVTKLLDFYSRTAILNGNCVEVFAAELDSSEESLIEVDGQREPHNNAN